MASAAVQRRQGRWASSIADFEKAVQLNPRSADAIGNLAQTYSLVRKYDLACATADKAIEITPDLSFPRWLKLQCLIGMDSLESAKAALRAALQSAGLVEMSRMAAGTGAIASFAVVPNFLLIADSTLQPRIEALTLADFADTAGLYQLKSDMYRARGRTSQDRAYLDSARTILESQVKAHPDEANFHARLGLVYANQGRKADALREGENAVKLLPVSREAYRGANIQATLAMIYAIAGMRSEAVDQLKYLLSVPSELSVGLLRHDPRWAPLRGDKRFEELLR
jgi:tetratricopeptide (TPR) repeat protein